MYSSCDLDVWWCCVAASSLEEDCHVTSSHTQQCVASSVLPASKQILHEYTGVEQPLLLTKIASKKMPSHQH